jgi:hypothetical protein
MANRGIMATSQAVRVLNQIVVHIYFSASQRNSPLLPQRRDKKLPDFFQEVGELVWLAKKSFAVFAVYYSSVILNSQLSSHRGSMQQHRRSLY